MGKKEATDVFMKFMFGTTDTLFGHVPKLFTEVLPQKVPLPWMEGKIKKKVNLSPKEIKNKLEEFTDNVEILKNITITDKNGDEHKNVFQNPLDISSENIKSIKINLDKDGENADVYKGLSKKTKEYIKSFNNKHKYPDLQQEELANFYIKTDLFYAVLNADKNPFDSKHSVTNKKEVENLLDKLEKGSLADKEKADKLKERMNAYDSNQESFEENLKKIMGKEGGAMLVQAKDEAKIKHIEGMFGKLGGWLKVEFHTVETPLGKVTVYTGNPIICKWIDSIARAMKLGHTSLSESTAKDIIKHPGDYTDTLKKSFQASADKDKEHEEQLKKEEKSFEVTEGEGNENPEEIKHEDIELKEMKNFNKNDQNKNENFEQEKQEKQKFSDKENIINNSVNNVKNEFNEDNNFKKQKENVLNNNEVDRPPTEFNKFNQN